MSGKSCYFIGHREAGEDIFPALAAAVEEHITVCGVGEFIVGYHGSFDSLAAREVVEVEYARTKNTVTVL